MAVGRGEFTKRLWSGVPDLGALDVGTTVLLLVWLEWVEVEVRGFEDLVEELHWLTGG